MIKNSTRERVKLGFYSDQEYLNTKEETSNYFTEVCCKIYFIIKLQNPLLHALFEMVFVVFVGLTGWF